ncbi:GNAT family N-acetyltransferase [Cytobacillus oceanisediminis]|uniref:GNAT family N-acetyltransferase n=1 Tax=Cytobacillus oceanisediminis TaxID=665099 RepID=UPI0024941BF0|nr:GNAT family N-acetyltransferase [Cytobacillus oceanisediminis]
MDWNIRKATLKDVEAITGLRIELLKAVGDVNEGNRAIVFEANRRYFQRKLSNGGFSAWVADIRGTIVAISGLVFFERPPHGENISGLEAYIMNMYTKPEYRGYGLGHSLLEKCIADMAAFFTGWLSSL